MGSFKEYVQAQPVTLLDSETVDKPWAFFVAQHAGFKIAGVYAIIHMPTMRMYVGSSVNLWRRWSSHKLALRKGDHHSKFLQRCWDCGRPGEFFFAVLATIDNIDDLPGAELYWIDRLKPAFNSLTSTPDRRSFTVSEETRKKMGESSLVGWARRRVYGTDTHSEETKKAMSKAATGRKHTAETIAKMSAAKKGARNPFTKEELSARAKMSIESYRRNRLAALTEEFGEEKAKELMAMSVDGRYVAIKKLRGDKPS